MANTQQFLLLFFLLFFLRAEKNTTQLKFKHWSDMIPHPQKIHKGGQDAFYQSERLIIVADGVGGWNNQGVDPSQYSRFLCKKAGELFSLNSQKYLTEPQKLIPQVVSLNQNPGSSTMSVATIFGNSLRSCHIGDCKLYILRRYSHYHMVFETIDQLHGFNFPFQLALPKYGGDNPHDSICSTVSVRKGDLVVLASDGFSDNIFSNQLLAIAQQHHEKNELHNLPQTLTQLATTRALVKSGFTPFSQKAREWGVEYTGGKVDDTTVIVAEIIEEVDQEL